MQGELKTFETLHRLIQQTINDLEVLTKNTEKEEIHWAISGGSTPKIIFKALAEPANLERINWDKIHFWWVDERCVVDTDPESNYGQARAILLDHLDLSPEQIHPINGELMPTQAAIEYIHQIKQSIKVFDHNLPVFDLVWLGMGEDGHTASLFPEHFSYRESSWVKVASNPKTAQARITLTLPVINMANEITFIVTGEAKANMLKRVLSGSQTSLIYPAANIKPKNGNLKWYVDREAASKLTDQVVY